MRDEVEKVLLSEEDYGEVQFRRAELLSTGSTLLNLALTGNPFGGWIRGHYFVLVGDSASGKTLLSLSCFAEAVRSPRFKDYRLIYDDVEGGCLFNIPRLFGKTVAERMEPPAVENGEPRSSITVEDFYFNLDDAIAKGVPFIYVLDSMDALTSVAAQEKFLQQKKACRKGVHATGSYGDGKAKKNSENLRVVLSALKRMGSILIILCQTRDNLGMGFEKTRAGGRALRFYATAEVWMSIVGTIKKMVLGRERKVGVRVKLTVKKNRITGLLREVEVPIYPSYGLDDLGACISMLVEEGYWEKKGRKIIPKGLDIEPCTLAKLIQDIEEKDLYKKVQELVGKCWHRIDLASRLPRKSRYEDVAPD